MLSAVCWLRVCTSVHWSCVGTKITLQLKGDCYDFAKEEVITGT